MDSQLASTYNRQRSISRTPWAKRIGLGMFLCLIVWPLIGLTYQSMATRIDARKYLPAGQLTNVGGYMLHIHCIGEGSPTVILEGGLGGTSLDWSLVQPEIAQGTRVCSYDRTGLGWSETDPDNAPRTSEQVAQELHTLLRNTGIEGPYVVVGLSAGGMHAQMFAAQYPDEVQGLILVDPTPAQLMASFASDARQLLLPELGQFALLEAVEPLGLMRLIPLPGSEILDDLPSEIRNRIRAVNLRTGAVAALHREAAGFEPSILQVASLESPSPQLPVTVIWHGIPAEPLELEPLAEDSLRELAAASDHGKFVIAENSGHYIPFERPDLVSNEINAMLKMIQRASQLDPLYLARAR